MKTCTRCQRRKPLREFHKNSYLKSGYKSSCKECANTFAKDRWREVHPAPRAVGHDAVAYTKQRLLAFRTWISSLKNEPCADCRQSFPAVCMDFDHVRGVKTKAISSMWSWERSKVQQELEKCDLVCANCHRIRTATRRDAQLQEVG